MPALTSAPDAGRARGVADNGIIDDEQGLVSLVGQAVDDARAVATAEITLFKARMTERLVAYQGAITFFAIAGVLALCGLIAMLVGMILSLATLIGPGLATLVVVVVVFAIAGVLAVIGKARLSRPKTGAGS